MSGTNAEIINLLKQLQAKMDDSDKNFKKCMEELKNSTCSELNASLSKEVLGIRGEIVKVETIMNTNHDLMLQQFNQTYTNISLKIDGLTASLQTIKDLKLKVDLLVPKVTRIEDKLVEQGLLEPEMPSYSVNMRSNSTPDTPDYSR